VIQYLDFIAGSFHLLLIRLCWIIG